MKQLFSVFAFTLALVSCVNEELINVETAPVDEAEVVSAVYEAGEVAVKFTDEMVALIEEDLSHGNIQTKSADLNQVLQSLGITSIRRMLSDGGEFEARRRAAGLHKWYYVTFDKNMPQVKAAADLSSVPGIEVAEPLRKIVSKSAGIDWNDFSSELWGYHNEQNPAFDINVVPVWKDYTTGDPKVIVGVFDDGVEATHEDLKDNCVYAYNYVDNAPVVPGDHGTHVAGVIGAAGNNGIGICGIAGGDAANNKPGVKLMGFQILTDEGGLTNKLQAYADAADKGVLISQNSWGYSYDQNFDEKIDMNELERAKTVTITELDKAAIDYFIKYAGCDAQGNQLPNSPMKGGIVIFAAGNDAIPYGSPADYSEVIAVGAIASNGERSSFSSYGDWVDICAPGTDIYSTVVGGYNKMSGTSMACPHVSGVAALVLSYHGGPGFTADMLKERILKSSVKPAGHESHISPSLKIGGLCDALGAMTYGDTSEAEPVTDLAAAGRGDNIDLTWTLTADSNGKPAYSVAVLYGKTKADVENAAVANYPSSVNLFMHTPSGNVGEKVSCTIPGLDFESEYYLKMYACTYSLNYSDPTDVIAVSTTKNNAPVISLTGYEEGMVLKPYETATISLSVTETDGHEFTVTYTPGSEADTFAKQPDGTWNIEIVGNKAPDGTYKPVLTVTDEFGLSAVQELTYVIEANAAPKIIKEIEDVVLYSKSSEFTLDMSEYVSDPDGEALKYTVNVTDSQIAHVTVKGNTLTGTPLKYGTTGVEIVAADARGESVTLSFTVLIKDPSSPVSVYPNPVVDFVNIGTLDEAETVIRITNQTGKLMHESVSVVSGHSPARIDMSSYAPGSYAISVSFGGKKYNKTVVKL